MPITINDIVRINANYSRGGGVDKYTNVWYFEVFTDNFTSDDQFMDQVAGFLNTEYGVINIDVAAVIDYDDIIGQNITQNELLPAKNWPSLVSGGAGIDAMPLQTCPYIFWRTLTPKKRGGKFLPVYTELANTGGGVLGSSPLTRMQSFGDAFVGTIPLLNGDLKYGPFNTTLLTFTRATSSHPVTRVRTQRRRTPGRGS